MEKFEKATSNANAASARAGKGRAKNIILTWGQAVNHVVASKLVDECDVDDEVGIASDVGTLDEGILSCHRVEFR